MTRAADRSRRRFRRCRALVLLALLALLGSAGSPARAELRGAIEAREVALLPEYCPHTITFEAQYGKNKAQQDAWFQRLGKSFNTLHHYCWALIALQRAGRSGTTPQIRDFNYNSAINDIEFVLKNAEESLVLMPEILTRKGEAHAKLKDFAAAEGSFKRALELRADYWPAYRGLAQVQLDLGRRDEARSVLETGLKRVSDPRALRRMLDELGGSKGK